MKFMVTWRISPGSHQAATERFLSSGAPVPPELKTIGDWHVPGSSRGWLLVEGNDMVALAQHMGEWANFLELEMSPVIEDTEAARGLAKAYGK